MLNEGGWSKRATRQSSRRPCLLINTGVSRAVGPATTVSRKWVMRDPWSVAKRSTQCAPMVSPAIGRTHSNFTLLT